MGKAVRFHPANTYSEMNNQPHAHPLALPECRQTSSFHLLQGLLGLTSGSKALAYSGTLHRCFHHTPKEKASQNDSIRIMISNVRFRQYFPSFLTERTTWFLTKPRPGRLSWKGSCHLSCGMLDRRTAVRDTARAQADATEVRVCDQVGGHQVRGLLPPPAPLLAPAATLEWELWAPNQDLFSRLHVLCFLHVELGQDGSASSCDSMV